MREPVGVSILTNGKRLEHLKRCVASLLCNCYYRPLVIAIFDNGSTDGTQEWCGHNPVAYGVETRNRRTEDGKDWGCAAGTNMSAALVRECKYVLHLESDFVHLPESMSGEDKLWLHRAVRFMDSSDCDYLYLRRMVDEEAIRLHWWDKWAGILQVSDRVFNYMRCPGFWWSNNPHLRRNDAIYEAGCLPLNEDADGSKGTPQWSRPELQAPKPGNTWIHKWGLFVHDTDPQSLKDKTGCGKHGDGYMSCKYGFFKDGEDRFCGACQGDKIADMTSHYRRHGGRDDMVFA